MVTIRGRAFDEARAYECRFTAVTPFTFNPQPSIPNLQPSTLNPNPRNLKPQTLASTPEDSNPKTQTPTSYFFFFINLKPLKK